MMDLTPPRSKKSSRTLDDIDLAGDNVGVGVGVDTDADTDAQSMERTFLRYLCIRLTCVITNFN